MSKTAQIHVRVRVHRCPMSSSPPPIPCVTDCPSSVSVSLSQFIILSPGRAPAGSDQRPVRSLRRRRGQTTRPRPRPGEAAEGLGAESLQRKSSVKSGPGSGLATGAYLEIGLSMYVSFYPLVGLDSTRTEQRRLAAGQHRLAVPVYYCPAHACCSCSTTRAQCLMHYTRNTATPARSNPSFGHSLPPPPPPGFLFPSQRRTVALCHSLFSFSVFPLRRPARVPSGVCFVIQQPCERTATTIVLAIVPGTAVEERPEALVVVVAWQLPSSHYVPPHPPVSHALTPQWSPTSDGTARHARRTISHAPTSTHMSDARRPRRCSLRSLTESLPQPPPPPPSAPGKTTDDSAPLAGHRHYRRTFFRHSLACRLPSSLSLNADRQNPLPASLSHRGATRIPAFQCLAGSVTSLRLCSLPLCVSSLSQTRSSEYR